MSTTGFKTQIKEEKRHLVLPIEIKRLKGFNPETGEPGECYFRGVRNNVRLDPVVGLIYPLPKKLFAPLTPITDSNELITESKEDTDNDQEQDEMAIDVVNENEPPEIKGKSEEKKGSKLDRIKQKAKEAEQKVSKGIIDNDGEKPLNNAVRNSIWDAGEEKEVAAAFEASEKSENGGKEGRIPIAPQQAIVNDAMNELEQKLAEKAQNGRNNRAPERG